MSPKRPLIFIVPGAWHSSGAYVAVQHALQTRGYPTACENLASLDNPKSSCAEDIAVLRRKVIAFLRQGLDVLIVAHSYGTVVASCAATGLTTADPGVRDGKVTGLMSVAGGLVREGRNAIEAFLAINKGEPLKFVDTDSPGAGLSVVKDVNVMFSGASPDQMAVLAAMLLPQGTEASIDPVGPPVWSKGDMQGKLAYVILTQDEAIKPDKQSPEFEATGAKWNVIEVEGSHGALSTKPEEMANVIVDFCEKCQGF